MLCLQKLTSDDRLTKNSKHKLLEIVRTWKPTPTKETERKRETSQSSPLCSPNKTIQIRNTHGHTQESFATSHQSHQFDQLVDETPLYTCYFILKCRRKLTQRVWEPGSRLSRRGWRSSPSRGSKKKDGQNIQRVEEIGASRDERRYKNERKKKRKKGSKKSQVTPVSSANPSVSSTFKMRLPAQIYARHHPFGPTHYVAVATRDPDKRRGQRTTVAISTIRPQCDGYVLHFGISSEFSMHIHQHHK